MMQAVGDASELTLSVTHPLVREVLSTLVVAESVARPDDFLRSFARRSSSRRGDFTLRRSSLRLPLRPRDALAIANLGDERSHRTQRRGRRLIDHALHEARAGAHRRLSAGSKVFDAVVGQTAAVASMKLSGVRVRHVLATEGDRLRELRLASLAADPDAFGSTYVLAAAKPPEHWEHWAAQSELGASQRTFVLEADDGRWLGLALVRLDNERPESAVLNAMWVAPEFRGRRGARPLCEACAAWAAERGCRELTLTVVTDNWAAQRAYRSAGFAICGETTWVGDGRTLNELVMHRLLDP
jgi:ribosomal protein S18 acetylase RimI-like enzyme